MIPDRRVVFDGIIANRNDDVRRCQKLISWGVVQLPHASCKAIEKVTGHRTRSLKCPNYWDMGLPQEHSNCFRIFWPTCRQPEEDHRTLCSIDNLAGCVQRVAVTWPKPRLRGHLQHLALGIPFHNVLRKIHKCGTRSVRLCRPKGIRHYLCD